jgi:hypothetical protein
MCTETLAAGINLPARSVVLTSLVKGPPGDQKLLEPSAAHQIFGRAGRPQFDTRGYVVAMAHEDDVRIARWKEKYDAIPEDTKDPGLLKAKKALKKKRPTRRETETYWNEAQFEKLKAAPPGKLYSKGQLPWRLLAYLLKLSPEVSRIRNLVRKRLMDEPRIKAAELALDRMLVTLAAGGYVRLLVFRSVNPLYGAFLMEHLGIADRLERIQAFESVLGLPRPILRYVRVPFDLPTGPLATTRLDEELIRRGLMVAPRAADDEDEDAPERSRCLCRAAAVSGREVAAAV